MKSIFKILISLILVIIISISSGIFYLSRGLDEGIKVKTTRIDVSNFNDGIYSGKYDAGRWSNVLNVTVKDHKITDINIVDDVTFAQQGASDEIFNKVIEAQNTTVDIISEATVTSKAYLKSIENALNSN